MCRRQAADVPYYIEQHTINIYSVEELCYFILSHMDALDEGLITEELCSWLEQELSMEELGRSLRKGRQEQRPLTELVRSILDSCGFCNAEEKRQIETSLKEVENKSETECMKIRADRNLKNHRYMLAIHEYNNLLERDEIKRADALLLGSIWNNIGVANAGMFLYQNAYQCFEKAYSYNNDPICLQEMEEAKKMQENIGKADVNMPVSEELSEELEQIRQYMALGDAQMTEQNWRNLLDKQEMIYENHVRFS